ncbi:fungal-specific transcription factor domain-containing protein [Aspergillus fruticulosus]
MSVGCLFVGKEANRLAPPGLEETGQALRFFQISQRLLGCTEYRDLRALQAICFMVIFLQSSARLSTCHFYIGIALRSATRLGLHRSVSTIFDPVERELRKRVFWTIQKMDIYLSTLLGLPQMLSDDDIDQQYPLDLDAQFIAEARILPMPPDFTPLMAGANAHTRLSSIMSKVIKRVYPVKDVDYCAGQRYFVSYSRIQEIEGDLRDWMEGLPDGLLPKGEAPPQLQR